MSIILKTTNLCKSFNGQTAVNNISLNIERNSVYGLLGPNGAGKSTSNALDYSPPQGTIYVTVQKTDCFLHISITDEGGGFTPEALHHAQEQFFMGDKSRTSNMHFGMGLYITSSIIKQHGGQLVLSNSKKTGGAQVIIKIPY